jgi:hypothetical protein
LFGNCTLADSERLEKIQLEAARIVTGLTSYASMLSIYKETGWEKTFSLAWKKKTLILSYFVFKHLLARRISQVCWQIVPESNSTWEKELWYKLSLPGGIVKC